MKKYFLIIILIFFANHAFSQNKYTISGYVKDNATGEYAFGATVFIKEILKGTTSNEYGFYSLSVPEGNYTIVTTYLGYETSSQSIVLDKNLRINTDISPISFTTKEVVISGKKKNANTDDASMSTTSLDMDQVKALPAFFGEVDVLKTIQLMPGVQAAGEGNSGFYVRGGGPDQNLILLDEAVVYNASHLFGFFSVFNSDAIKNMKLIKGGMPAKYGGRLASVVDMTMKEGNSKEYHAEGGIGLIASRLTVEGPIKKDTSSFIVSGRRTYIGELAQLYIDSASNIKGSNYYFYDLNAKVNYRISDKDRLFLSGYFGRDVFVFNNVIDAFKIQTKWGNATVSSRWNHLFNDKLFVNTSLIFSDYQFDIDVDQDQFKIGLYSGITDYNGKVDFSYYPSILHKVKFGANYIHHTFTPSTATASSGDVEFETGESIKNYAHDISAYISDDWSINEKFRTHLGLRFTSFIQHGPFTRFQTNPIGNITDTIRYGKGETVKSYGGIEPRFTLRYAFNESASLKTSYTRNYQYIHLAALSSVALPTDIWVPSTDRVQPQIGSQYALGFFKNLKDNHFETSVETYYKTMDNLIEYKEGALPEDDLNNNVDNNFTFGSGNSYGAEFFVKKKQGKINGWVGYTLSWTNRTFLELNNGNTFPAKYDRRHDISVVGSWEISKRLTFGATFVYATGNALTLPVSRYLVEGNIVSRYGERNSYRMDPYHRLDLSLTLFPKEKEEKRRFSSNWNLSVYNVYNRHNPYFIYFSSEGNVFNGDLKLKANQMALFGIIPSITWNFKF